MRFVAEPEGSIWKAAVAPDTARPTAQIRLQTRDEAIAWLRAEMERYALDGWSIE